jgi:hypothetical protein
VAIKNTTPHGLDSGKFSGKVRFHEGFRLRTANKDGNCSSAYVRRVSGFFKTRILEELPTLQLQRYAVICYS